MVSSAAQRIHRCLFRGTCDARDVAKTFWPYVHEVRVEWRDLDAAGHVNNAVYLSYMESARNSAYLAMKGGGGARDVDIILARAAIDFRSAATMGDHLRIEVRPGRVGDSSFTLHYRIVEVAAGRLVAEGESVAVAYDYEKKRKKPLDERLRTRLAIDDDQRA